MSTQLIKLDAAKRALAEASTLEDIKKIEAAAHGMENGIRACIKACKEYDDTALEEQNNWAEIRIRAQRKGGGLLAKLPLNPGKRTDVTSNVNVRGSTKRAQLKENNLNHGTANRWEKVATVPETKFEKHIVETKAKKKELTSVGVINLGKKIKHQETISNIKDEIELSNWENPTGSYDVLAVDPPWPYGTSVSYDSESYRVGSPYPEMSLEQIKKIELPAKKDCVLWLWTTHKFMRDSFDILDNWEFQDKIILTWVKDKFGTGRWLRSQTEFCIMAVKGKPVIDLTNQTSVIFGAMREHSRKPDQFYELVDSLCVGYKLDYFSREKRTGWDVWGVEAGKFSKTA